MKSIVIALALCVSLARLLFAAEIVKVDGEVYITQANAATVRMSSVKVYFVENSRALEVMKIARELRKRKAINDDMRERAKELVKLRGAQGATARKTLAQFDVLVRSNQAVSLRQMEAIGITLQSVNSLELSQVLREADWKAAHKAETDADGKFSIALPAGEWTAVARAQRRVVDKEEDYFWIQTVKPGQKFLLNNNNVWVE